ncbi:hypothetical protein AMTR_s00096p00161330 [Amborella trichopoda]|uniref:Uncharacterized protein n=1 Tax=Amborella trichopoda TaxID=13333 RepID=W1P457_AMBTC|nr:hypothetical protein AMTR_s00096p00161330 [Amborella trichopoda]
MCSHTMLRLPDDPSSAYVLLVSCDPSTPCDFRLLVTLRLSKALRSPQPIVPLSPWLTEKPPVIPVKLPQSPRKPLQIPFPQSRLSLPKLPMQTPKIPL